MYITFRLLSARPKARSNRRFRLLVDNVGLLLINYTAARSLNDYGVWCAAVVVYCHTKFSVMARFLFRAQDRNMTNGDFAFFHFRTVRTYATDTPWIIYGRGLADADLLRRRRAFLVVKQVCTVTTQSKTLVYFLYTTKPVILATRPQPMSLSSFAFRLILAFIWIKQPNKTHACTWFTIFC